MYASDADQLLADAQRHQQQEWQRQQIISPTHGIDQLRVQVPQHQPSPALSPHSHQHQQSTTTYHLATSPSNSNMNIQQMTLQSPMTPMSPYYSTPTPSPPPIIHTPQHFIPHSVQHSPQHSPVYEESSSPLYQLPSHATGSYSLATAPPQLHARHPHTGPLIHVQPAVGGSGHHRVHLGDGDSSEEDGEAAGMRSKARGGSSSWFSITGIFSFLLTAIVSIFSGLLRAVPSSSSFSTAMANLRYAWRYYGPFRRKKNQPWHAALFNRRTIVFLLLLFALVYAIAFSYSCTSIFGCRAWPFGKRPPKANVPFTIISLLRDMSEETLLKDKSQFVIQWNALISWAMVVPASQILIYMDTAASCRKIMSQPELTGLTCLVVPCWHEEHKRPLLDCIFRVAHEHATTEIIAYVNGDILLHSDVQLLVNQISSWFKDFLIVSRRTDTLVPQHVLDEFSTKSSQDQVLELLDLAITQGQMHSEFGIDLFCYPKSLFNDLNFPPYLAGVYRWDNWLLSEMILREHVAVIDVTRQGLVVHQEMGKVGHQGRTGAAYNDAIAKSRSGLKYRIGNIQNTDYVVRYEQNAQTAATGDATTDSLINSQQESLQFRLIANHNASIEVLIAKRVNPDGWLAILPVSHFDLSHGHVSNWLCWADRINFTSFIFIAEDRVSGRELHRRGIPVLQFDEALEVATEDATIHSGDGLSVGPHSSTGARTTIENFDFLMFRQEFLSMVLRAGFHFLYSHLNTIWLEDPLRYMAEGKRGVYGGKSFAELDALHSENLLVNHDFDVAATGNETYFDAHFLAVRSTQWGKYLWKQIYLCEESNGAILYAQTLASARKGQTGKKQPQVVDCLNDVLTKHHSKIRRQLLPSLLFPNHAEFFVKQETQLLGIMPVVVQDDMEMTLLNSMAVVGGGQYGTIPTTTTSTDSITDETDADSIRPVVPSSVWSNSYTGRIQVYKANQIQRWKEWKLLAIHVAKTSTSGAGSNDDSTGSSDLDSSTGLKPRAPKPVMHPCIHLDPNPLSTPPVSKQAWDAYHAALKKGTVNPADPSPLDFQFKIRILTFDRPRSLARLLDSLNQVLWDADDRITLEVSIDYPRDMNDEESVHNWRLVATICDSFTWKYGVYSVIHQQQNIGLTGQWTWGWNNPDVKAKEIILFLEDDTSLVPLSWKWMKHVIQQYYLNPYNYDPNMYGFSLQSQHTILGESKQFKYGSRLVHDMMSHDTFYYRYQLLGTWGTVFFPEHWMVFTQWLKSRSFQHTQGTSAIGFKPCVPTLLSNLWWNNNPKRVWSQWMVRFAFEKGWYSLYTNFRNQSSMVVNFREGGLNFKVAKGPMNPPVEELPEEYMNLPPLASLPLYDFHFRDWSHQPSHLKYHAVIMGAAIPPPGFATSPTPLPQGMFRDDCYIMNHLKNVQKIKEDTSKALAAELSKLESKHSQAQEQQKRLAEQSDSLQAMKQELSADATEQQYQAIKRKEDALKQARKEAESQWKSDAKKEKEEIAQQHAAKLERQRARKEREALDREALRQRELAEEEEERRLEEQEKIVAEAAKKAARRAEKKKAKLQAEKEERKKRRANGHDDAEEEEDPDEPPKTKSKPLDDDDDADEDDSKSKKKKSKSKEKDESDTKKKKASDKEKADKKKAADTKSKDKKDADSKKASADKKKKSKDKDKDEDDDDSSAAEKKKKAAAAAAKAKKDKSDADKKKKKSDDDEEDSDSDAEAKKKKAKAAADKKKAEEKKKADAAAKKKKKEDEEE